MRDTVLPTGPATSPPASREVQEIRASVANLGPAALDFPSYEAGSWGPDAADRLLQRNGRSSKVM